MNYFEKHIGDYLKDTSHLSLLEHGVYNRLFDVYYTREGGIPDDQAARLIGARSRDEKAALKDVLQEFFELVDGAWLQARCESEIARFKDKQTKAKRSAEARWSGARPVSDGNANASPGHVAQTMRTHSEGNAPQAPSPKPQSPDPNNQDSASAVPSPGEACRAMKLAGLQQANPSSPKLIALLQAGITIEELVSATQDYPRKSFAYVLAAAEGRRRDATTAPLPPPGMDRPPSPTETSYARRMREQYEAVAPGIAARRPGASPTPDFIDMEATDVTPHRLG